LPVSQEALDEVALSRAEYEAIVDRLGREPDPLELGLFGSLWSEHCGYKHTSALLRLLPGTGPRLLVAPGAENAGVIDLGDGLAIAMKMESHNHPSAVEPHEGAATGIGGIVRDIFAMGARPIALLNSLRFGPLDIPRNRFLVAGVVGGIADYGNCIGVPDVGGEISFDSCYSGNPLINVMCVGLLDNARLMSATARAPGDFLMLVGADTGRDGMHGASGLASRTFEDQAEMRSAIQVGNPFLEKVLIEACLEAARLDVVGGMQDCGAAGITSAAIEMAERSGLGLRVYIDRVPRREEGMTPYEVMLSESQERMLLSVDPGGAQEVRDLFGKWDLDATVIGEFEESDNVTCFDNGVELTSTPIALLEDPPEYVFDPPRPQWLTDLQNTDMSSVPLPACSPSDALLQLLASPNIASKRSVYRQYDHQVQTNTVTTPGTDSAVLRLKGTKRGIAVTVDGNGRLCYLEPFAGTAIAVAESFRNLACSGAEPVAVTDCLNFGDPETPDIQYQLRQSILGMKEACEKFGVPVVSGNASLYNEARGQAVYPTPTIGALGLLDDVDQHATSAFQQEGDRVVLLGAARVEADPSDLAGSELMWLLHDRVEGRPGIDLDLESRVQEVCRDAIRQGLLSSAHDCSDGGLAVAIAESAVQGGIGADVTAEVAGRWDAALFGERQSRIVVSLPPENLERLTKLADGAGVPHTDLGTTGSDRLRFSDVMDVALDQATEAWAGGFDRAASD